MRALPPRHSGGCSRPERHPYGAAVPLLGLDCDNGGEFINAQLFRWCEQEAITFTRSRPFRKNDNCFVEQKNWPVVRQQVGYPRCDAPDELDALRELYRQLRLYVNFFQPQMKLLSKTRKGAKVSKSFDVARTPYQRVLASPHVSEEYKEKCNAPVCDLQIEGTLRATYLELNPVQLKRAIIRCQDSLIELAQSKTKERKEVTAPLDHPFRDTFSPRVRYGRTS